MGLFYFVMFTYILFLAGFIWLSMLNIRQDRQNQEWNDATRVEIKAMRSIQVDFAEELKSLQEFRRTFEALESEPDVKFSPRKENLK